MSLDLLKGNMKNKSQIIIDRKNEIFWPLVFLFITLATLYQVIIRVSDRNTLIVILVLLTLFSLGLARVVFNLSSKIVFDFKENRVLKNGKLLCYFDEIECFELGKYQDENSYYDTFDLELKIKKKAGIELSKGQELAIYQLAQELARHTKKELRLIV